MSLFPDYRQETSCLRLLTSCIPSNDEKPEVSPSFFHLCLSYIKRVTKTEGAVYLSLIYMVSSTVQSKQRSKELKQSVIMGQCGKTKKTVGEALCGLSLVSEFNLCFLSDRISLTSCHHPLELLQLLQCVSLLSCNFCLI